MNLTENRPESRRRNEIAQAAFACFERLGPAATRIEDVLAEAGIARSTFYRHFRNIDELVKYLIARSTRVLVEQAVASSMARNADPVDAVSEVIALMVGRDKDTAIIQMLGLAEVQRFSYLMSIDPDAMTQLFGPLHTLLAKGQRDGVLRHDLEVDAMVEWVSRNIASMRFRRPIEAQDLDGLKAYARQFVMPAITATAQSGADALEPRLSRMEHMLETLIGAKKPR